MLGTDWVAPGEGDTIETLERCIGPRPSVLAGVLSSTLTNLRLTGREITDRDRRRWAVVGASGEFGPRLARVRLSAAS